MLKAQIIGRLGKDAEIKKSNKGDFITFSVAVNIYGQDEPVWVSVAYNNVKLLPYLLKGTQVYVDGNLNMRSFRKDNGETIQTLSITNSTVQLLGAKKDNELQNLPTYKNISNTNSKAEIEKQESDDLPF